MIPFLLLQWRKFVIGFHGMDAMKIKIRLPQNSSFLFPCFLACSNQRRWTHWSVMSRKSHISFLRLYPSSHPLVSHFLLYPYLPHHDCHFLVFSIGLQRSPFFIFFVGGGVGWEDGGLHICKNSHTFLPKETVTFGCFLWHLLFERYLSDNITNIHKDFTFWALFIW